MTSIRRPLPTPLETEYKEQLKQNARDSKQAKRVQPDKSSSLQDDIVTLSSASPESGDASATLKPSQPVTVTEKKFLNNQFSTYA